MNRWAEQYKLVRSGLKQVAQKRISRWLEHYRLYNCISCGQQWQASLMSGGLSDNFCLYKVPTIKVSEWLAEHYICPTAIVAFNKSIKTFLQQDFVQKLEECRDTGCVERAVTASVFCLRHQIESLIEAGSLAPRPKGRWFGPYSADMVSLSKYLE